MDRNARTWRRFNGADSAKLIAYAYPDAHGSDLDLAVDMMCVFFIVDEIFDGPLRDDPKSATMVVDELVGTLTPGTVAARSSLSPLATHFAGMWAQTTHGMAAPWQERAAHHWIRYLWGNVCEDVDRALQPPRTLDDYLALRRHVVGYRPCQDMIERVSGYEIPSFLWHQSALQALGDLCTDLIVLSNDIYSLEKEQDRGESMNAILLLARTAGSSPRVALQQVNGLASRLAAGFPAAAARVRDLADHLHLAAGRRNLLDRWIDANRNWLGAHNRWACEIPRYGAGSDPVQPDNEFLRTLLFGR
ncbi:terpene synthase family protein [Kitasatospora sp. NPDC057500]|uniref:terpene synthase family protein n=1 Tax=Kitasatospora sp. NPDC057500 TaxID=3346151 RepID=UPI003674112E